MHCEDPGCLKACPSPGAIVQYSNGIVDFDHEKCIGCGYCIKGCPFDIPRISQVDHKAYKCTLCSDRVAVGQGPACARTCPTHAIVFGTKDEMKQHAAERIKDLQSRGYRECRSLRSARRRRHPRDVRAAARRQAGNLCGACRKTRRISPIVEIWKGLTKYAGMAAMGAFAAIGVLHYLVSGPNKVQPKDEEDAKRLTGSR